LRIVEFAKGRVTMAGVRAFFHAQVLDDGPGRAGVYPEWTTALHRAAFNVISVATTTGFATCAGSTGGGIKLSRSLLLMKQVQREFTRLLHPRAARLVMLLGRLELFAVLAAVRVTKCANWRTLP
jgi:Trk-type K+ transport system membrane component